ncbi:MAG: phage holin family protein [Bacillota bacterium]
MLTSLIINMFALILTAFIIPGIYISGVMAGLLAALVLGLVNILVRPILTILTLPLTILTFGLFLLVINGLSLMITAYFVPGFQVEGLLSAVFGAIILSLVSGMLRKSSPNKF